MKNGIAKFIQKIIAKGVRTKTQGSPTKWSLKLIGELEWKRFEEVCAHYFQVQGRKAKLTKRGADGGIDFYLYDHDNPNKVMGVAQCKAWETTRIGIDEIQRLYGIMKGEDCKIAVFFTTSSYTKPAEEWAEKKHIVLVDRAKLLKKIQTELSDQQQKELLSEATKGDYRTPTCVNCDIKLVPREGKNGKPFWGCKNYPISGCDITSSENIDYIVAQSTAEATRSCPKCNGELVLRTAGRGQHKGNQFWGCKNYYGVSGCSYIENL